jgi:hypothetical protein
MPSLKQTVLTAVATAALACLPVTPAAAAVPLLFAPWAVGHILGAGARLATLPWVVASAAASAAQPQAPYPMNRGYYAQPGYYAAPNYYARPPAYYGTPQGYYAAPQAYYRPALAYAPAMPRYYSQPRGYYASRAPYPGSYGAQSFYRSGGFAYRRR